MPSTPFHTDARHAHVAHDSPAHVPGRPATRRGGGFLDCVSESILSLRILRIELPSLPPLCCLCVLCGLFSTGCAFQDHRKALERMHAAGDYPAAARDLDDPSTRGLYGDKNQLLWNLDRGSVALALKDDQQCIGLLEQAEEYADAHRKITAGQEASRWLLDDTAVPYIAEPYEDIYINVLKLLAQLEQGKIEGGATVEARRLANKANELRDKYLEYRDAISKKGGESGGGFDRAASEMPPDLVSINEAGNFLESPLGTYLTAITFMKAGDPQNQGVAGRRLLDSIRLQHALIGPVREDDFQGLGERAPESASVLIVALSGRCPTKEAQRIGPIPAFDWPVYFELPVLVGGSREVGSVRVLVSQASPGDVSAEPPQEEGNDNRRGPEGGEPVGGSGGGKSYPLALVEDLGLVSNENHRRELPNIYARTLLRSSLKAGASFAITQSIRHQSHSRNQQAAAIGAVLIGLAAVTATERADLRCWVFLPGQAHVGLLDLPPGKHRIRVEYCSHSGGVVYSSPWRNVSVPAVSPATHLTTIVDHYWR
jgi:hypothetical protein